MVGLAASAGLVEGVLLAASVGLVEGVLLAASVGLVEGVLLAASVGRTLSPSAGVVVLLKSDFLAYYC
jgi:outer membrane lipoprotein SlyB